MSGSIKFFQYNMRPRDIVMNTMTSEEAALKKQEKLNQYAHIYKDGFCKAYDIKCTDRDVESFLYLVKKHIINRHNPEGVDYKPAGSNVRLWIAPHHNSLQIGVSSYDPQSDYDWNFKVFTQLLTAQGAKKSNNLEERIKR